MKRKHEVKGIIAKRDVRDSQHPDSGGIVYNLVGDVRVRVDMDSLARQFGPRAITCRSNRITFFDGAVEIDGFNKRVETKEP